MDGSTTGTPAVCNLPAQEASRNGDAVVRRDNVIANINMDGSTTGTPAVRNLPAREASRNSDAVVRQDNVIPNINMDGSMTGTPAVRNLHAQEASRDEYASIMYTEAGSVTGTPPVHNLHARKASRDGDAVVQQDNVVPNINMGVGKPGYPEAQHRSIEDGTADADAMEINDTVNDDPIGLQIEAGTSDKTVKAVWLVATRTPIGGKVTA